MKFVRAMDSVTEPAGQLGQNAITKRRRSLLATANARDVDMLDLVGKHGLP